MGSTSTGIQVVLVVVLFQVLVQGQEVPSLINPDPRYYQSQESNEKIEYMCVSEELENHLDVDPAICQTKCQAKSMLNHQLLTGSTTEKLYRAYLEDHNQMAQGSSGSRKKRSSSFDYFNFPDTQWPLFEPIKFKFDQGAKEHAYIEKEIVRDAFRKWQAETCIRFEEVPTNEFLLDIHIVITKGTGCISFVGKGEVVTQPLYLAGPCFDEFGTILHEIAHLIGLWHETQRPDRDDFVKIIYDNVADYESGNFAPLFGDLVNTNDIVFDYSSIMTFHSKSYSKTPGNLITVETLDPLYQRTIGQRAEISFNDSRLVNELYCEDWCSTKITCRNSGYQDPNYCSRCRCPDGFTGTYCERYQGEQDYEGESCGGALTVDDSEQEISSPGFDTRGHYNNNQYCVWTLKTRDPTKQIDITIDDDFGIYCSAHQSCYQWLEIRHKNNMFDLGPRWCCNDLHANFVRSERNEAMVIFKAKYKVDEARLRRGFKIRFKAYPVSSCQQLCQNGRCRNDKCVCNPGYIGDYCTTKEDFCKSRPCRNGGTCIDGLDDYTCLCDSGFRGPQCQQVQPNCGACDGAPSFLEIPCEDPSQTEVIQQMCCRDVTYTAPDGSLSVRQEFYQCNITRNLMYCCDNAEMIDVGTMSMCAVTGWTGWSGCDADCGACGKRRRYNYFVSRVWNNGLEKRELDVDLEVEPCNFRTCTTQDCWWASVDRCQCPCCGLYVDNGYGMCVPSGIVVN